MCGDCGGKGQLTKSEAIEWRDVCRTCGGDGVSRDGFSRDGVSRDWVSRDGANRDGVSREGSGDEEDRGKG